MQWDRSNLESDGEARESVEQRRHAIGMRGRQALAGNGLGAMLELAEPGQGTSSDGPNRRCPSIEALIENWRVTLRRSVATK